MGWELPFLPESQLGQHCALGVTRPFEICYFESGKQRRAIIEQCLVSENEKRVRLEYARSNFIFRLLICELISDLLDSFNSGSSSTEVHGTQCTVQISNIKADSMQSN